MGEGWSITIFSLEEIYKLTDRWNSCKFVLTTGASSVFPQTSICKLKQSKLVQKLLIIILHYTVCFAFYFIIGSIGECTVILIICTAYKDIICYIHYMYLNKQIHTLPMKIQNQVNMIRPCGGEKSNVL